MSSVHFAASHGAIRAYHRALAALRRQNVDNETSVRSAFQELLSHACRSVGWTFIPELAFKGPFGRVVPDGTIRDANSYPRGWWEAKDTRDDLDREIVAKRGRGYPVSNIVFDDSSTAVLIQNSDEVMRVDVANDQDLALLLERFFNYVPPDVASFEEAVNEFEAQVGQLATGLADVIDRAHSENSTFRLAYERFFETCRRSLNKTISRQQIDEMLVQHLLTERLIRTVFVNSDFVRHNIIANEIETVIDALVGFSRESYLRHLNYFYDRIEAAARHLSDFSDKQDFLNSLYGRFFKSFSELVWDKQGIVYTPQPIVNFMCASVQAVLNTHFGLSLDDDRVYVLDPCTGTGNFVVNLLGRASPRDVRALYSDRVYANETMLLPYYVAALNIEHWMYDTYGEYAPFEGLCFVDTLSMAEHEQHEMFVEANTARVERQKEAPIKVIIGNPPYNVGQKRENENNRNQTYKILDERIRSQWARGSTASSVSKVYNTYVRFFRWAVDRLKGAEGVICFITANNFVRNRSFDAMRRGFEAVFTDLYHVDLGGDVRRNPKLSGTKHNVFGIKDGVGITLGVVRNSAKQFRIHYYSLDEYATREEKFDSLRRIGSTAAVPWQEVHDGRSGRWLSGPESGGVFDGFIPLGSKLGKAAGTKAAREHTIFRKYSIGVNTNRDAWVYGFDQAALKTRVRDLSELYNSEVDRWRRRSADQADVSVDDFVLSDETRIKWSSRLKEELVRGTYATFREEKVRVALYRPFVKKFLYFDEVLNQRRGLFPLFFPTPDTQNLVIAVPGPANRKPFGCLLSDQIIDLDVAFEKAQCFPISVYAKSGGSRRHNVTDWALQLFRGRYPSLSISKDDIFYYVYAVLHSPWYRATFDEALREQLPRVPLAKDFGHVSEVGRALAELHVNFERCPRFPLDWQRQSEERITYGIDGRLRLSKDRVTIQVNSSLRLSGVPREAFDYRIGNRSALEWMLDQYRVSTDASSQIKSDPNRTNPKAILESIERVITVSVESLKLISTLPQASSEFSEHDPTVAGELT